MILKIYILIVYLFAHGFVSPGEFKLRIYCFLLAVSKCAKTTNLGLELLSIVWFPLSVGKVYVHLWI